MPRSRRRSRRRSTEDDEDEDDDAPAEEEEVSIPVHKSQRLSSVVNSDNDDDDENALAFTQHCAPDCSQGFPVAKAYERDNLSRMSDEERQKIIMEASRIVLFKALAGEPIERLKCVKLATANKASPTNSRINNAVWEEVKANLSNVFGIELVKPPHFMEKYLPKKYNDRYFCINGLEDDTGSHSKAIHSIHSDNAIGKGFLMVVLALTFCKGSLRHGHGPIRFINENELYQLLNGLDESLPPRPPPASSSGVLQTITTVNSQTPDVDALLNNFVILDYLWKSDFGDDPSDPIYSYAMGPKSALEVGRRQIIYFCSEILDEQPDPTMLQELEEDENGTQTQTQMQATSTTQ